MNQKLLERRSFLRLGAAVTFAGFGLTVVGCGSPLETGSSLQAEGDQKKVIKDIQVSSVGGIPGGILTAAAIVSGETVTLYCDEGSHKHPYNVGKADYEKLINGQTITIKSQIAPNGFNHTHDMVIDPKRNPRNARSETIEPDAGKIEDKNDKLDGQNEIDHNEIEQDEESKMYAAVSEGDEANLYIASKEELESASYCVGPKDACIEDLEVPGVWKSMTVNDKSFFMSDKKIVLADDLKINVRGKAKTGSKILELFLKLASK